MLYNIACSSSHVDCCWQGNPRSIIPCGLWWGMGIYLTCTIGRVLCFSNMLTQKCQREIVWNFRSWRNLASKIGALSLHASAKNWGCCVTSKRKRKIQDLCNFESSTLFPLSHFWVSISEKQLSFARARCTNNLSMYASMSTSKGTITRDYNISLLSTGNTLSVSPLI